jgi:hypothetical protein
MFDYTPKRADYGGVAAWILWLFFIAIVLIALGFALNWFAKPAELFSPDRFEMLSRQANESYQALEAQERSITAIRAKAEQMITAYGEDMSKWPQGKRDEYLQLQQQVTNLTVAYNAACARYKAMWQDEWRAISAPGDLPTTCQMLD